MLSQGDGLDNLIQQVSFVSYFYDFVIKSALGTLTKSKSDLVICVAAGAHIAACRAHNSPYNKNTQMPVLSGQFLLILLKVVFLPSCWSQNVYTSSKQRERVYRCNHSYYTLLFDFTGLAEKRSEATGCTEL